DMVKDSLDATLEEPCARLQEGGGPLLSLSTLCRALQVLELPLKKEDAPRFGARHPTGASLASSLVAEGPTDRRQLPGFRGRKRGQHGADTDACPGPEGGTCRGQRAPRGVENGDDARGTPVAGHSCRRHHRPDHLPRRVSDL